MAKLIYTALTSLDGYVADKNGKFDWAEPDEEVHTFVNDLLRPVGTHIYGRRMYEVMAAWQTMQTRGQAQFIANFADLWRSAEKVVYSTSLEVASTPRTWIERVFDPEAIRLMKASAQRDLTISGPTLAAHAFRADLVDDCHLFIAPIMVGGGLSAFPRDVLLHLALQQERRFSNGTVYLHYRSTTRRAV
ncbi:MAG: dihydrofolate reductase family protein [bacterium]